jgi:hypothetical protein
MRRPLALAAALAVLLGGRLAGAYCRAAACPPETPGGSTQGQRCTPAAPGDCGIPLQWRQPCISFSVQQDASRQVDYATADRVITQAFATWAAVDCGGGHPSIQVLDFSPVECTLVEYNQHAGNANILVFRDDHWPHDTSGGGVDILALTTVTYDVDTGDIYDADIEVNTASNTFSTTETPGPMDDDLLSVLTHETGHFLGLAHTQTYPATMFPDYLPGTDGLRTLRADDEEAICAVYPVGRQAEGMCTGIPRHGFASECGAQQTDVRCVASGAPGSAGSAPPGVVCAAALAALALLTGRRARRGT